MSDREVMGAGIDNGEPASPVATNSECVKSKAAKEAVLEAWIERDDFLFVHCQPL